ncbi:hypothetical protein ABEX97_15460 [Bacillus velezensis]
MKHGKRPTRAQKNVIKSNGLNPNNWLVSKNLQHEHRLIIGIQERSGGAGHESGGQC